MTRDAPPIGPPRRAQSASHRPCPQRQLLLPARYHFRPANGTGLSFTRVYRTPIKSNKRASRLGVITETKPNPMVCTSCGKETADTANICDACGDRILRPTPRPETPPTPLVSEISSSPAQQNTAEACSSKWWIAYLGYLTAITVALHRHLNIPIDPQPQSVTRPLGYLLGLVGIALAIVLVPGMLIALYLFVKAIALRSTKITVSRGFLIAFLSVSTTIIAFLVWVGSNR